MLKTALAIGLSFVVAACSVPAKPTDSDQPIYEIDAGRRTTLRDLLPHLMQQQIVIVGEHHNNEEHHWAQLRVIQALREAGADVAVGLEMFRSDSQADLDRWVSGGTDAAAFEKVYYDNWNFPWNVYRMIFEYARDHRIPMIGLNVPREITGQVAKSGFASLSEAQRGKLSDITCRVDEDYMNYIRKAFGAHGHTRMNFEYFCEAQLVWDSIMAVNAIEHVNKHPNTVVVIICGMGHARKGAIPRQIKDRSDLTQVVLLPEVPEILTPETVTIEDADYLLLATD